MIGTLRGIITGIDRANQQVHATLEDGQEVDAAYLGGMPPWPLSVCMFTDDPTSLCLGALGHRRFVLHDDFLGTTAGAGAVTIYSDSPWAFAVTGTASIDNLTDPGDRAAGNRRLLAPANSTARVRQADRAINLPEDGTAIHMSARVRVNANLVNNENTVAKIGLANSNVVDSGAPAGTDAAALIEIGGASPVVFRTRNGVATTAITSGEAYPAGSWLWLDIVVVSGTWAAFWIDGSGPYVIQTDVPLSTGQAVTPFAWLSSLTGTSHFILDLIDVDLVGPVASPVDYALDATSAQH